MPEHSGGVRKNSPKPNGPGDVLFGVEDGSADVVVQVIAVVGNQVGSMKLNDKIAKVETLI